ncbi:MAG TPA: ATP-binding protein, partial [Bacillota bacterium]|nr:ATP-binding protein [Bacillota bacterium]
TRFQTYLQVLESYGIPYNPEIVIRQDWLYEHPDGIQKITNLLNSGRYDALAGASDWLVRQIVNIMEERGIPLVPIVGFDDDIQGQVQRPTFTTIRPPFVEIGYRAVELMLEMLAGCKDVKSECLPCDMIIRRSCGCGSVLPQRVERWEGNLFNHGNDLDGQGDNESVAFGKLVDSLTKAPRLNIPDWKENLYKVFLAEAQGGEKNLFFNYLESLLNKVDEDGGDFESWNDIILALSDIAKHKTINRGFDLAIAEKLVRQGIILIADTSVRAEISKRLVEGLRHFQIMTVGHIMGRSLDLGWLLDRLYGGLQSLGIISFYLAVYVNPESSYEQVRLILASDINGVRLTQVEGLVYPAALLVPEGLLPVDQRFNYIVKPIFFQNRNIGLILLQANEKLELADYEVLSNTISITLNGVMSIKDLEDQARKLSKANTKLEEAYQSLQENQQKLLISEKMASLGRLTAGIAHEMNTPLATIRASLKTLRDLVDEYQQSIGNPQIVPEDYQSIAADMNQQLNLAEQAAAKNADFLRGIKAQTIDLKFTNLQWFNVAFVIKDTLNVLGFALKKGLCKLVTDFDESIRLYGDPRRLVQVITNLVMNGIDACKPDGGVITVTLTNSGDGFAEILVQDTGCGIPAEIISKIFDPMFTTKPFGEGTGLGLSITHELVDEYQGTISVNSQKGLTAFKIRLPLNKEA